MITIFMVNYNSIDFVKTNLHAIYSFTANPFKVIICDNGSKLKEIEQLRILSRQYNNLFILVRKQSAFGSHGHGEALNILSGNIDTLYGAIFDADCIPLQYGWDNILINMLSKTCKIAGTPAVSFSGSKKAIDFPLMFLCLFESSVFKKLKIDFRPCNLSVGQDTGWQLREKYLSAGYSGGLLSCKSTRSFHEGPFKGTICAEYYSSNGQLFCAHFGRGSNPRSQKYGFDIISKIQAKRLFNKDKKRWLFKCRELIESEKHKG